MGKVNDGNIVDLNPRLSVGLQMGVGAKLNGRHVTNNDGLCHSLVYAFNETNGGVQEGNICDLWDKRVDHSRYTNRFREASVCIGLNYMRKVLQDIIMWTLSEWLEFLQVKPSM